MQCAAVWKEVFSKAEGVCLQELCKSSIFVWK